MNTQLRKTAGQNSLPVSRNMRPAKELYRPPYRRMSCDFSTPLAPGVVYPSNFHLSSFVSNGQEPQYPMYPYNRYQDGRGCPMPYGQQNQSMECYVDAPVFVPSQASGRDHFSSHMNHLSRSGSTSSKSSDFSSEAKSVHFAENDMPLSNRNSGQSSYALKRSKSLGSADMKNMSKFQKEYNIGVFSIEMQNLMNKAVDSPSLLSARQMIEVVRQVFNRVVESSSYAEAAARLCVNIIKKDTSETFLETLINNCKAWYLERDSRLAIASENGGTFNDRGASSAAFKCSAFVTFLNDLYVRVKENDVKPKNIGEEESLSRVLLALLGDCLRLFLYTPTLCSRREVECLFFVLTSIGRDLETDEPLLLDGLVCAIRDALFNPNANSEVRKTLMQLIELHAAGWTLPVPAVIYYYPVANK